jgi:hypothetical protein
MHPPKPRKRLKGMNKQCAEVLVREMDHLVPRDSMAQHNFRAGVNSTTL